MNLFAYYLPNFRDLGPSFSDNTSDELVGNRHFMRLLRGLRPVLVSCKCGQSCNNEQITNQLRNITCKTRVFLNYNIFVVYSHIQMTFYVLAGVKFQEFWSFCNTTLKVSFKYFEIRTQLFSFSFQSYFATLCVTLCFVS